MLRLLFAIAALMFAAPVSAQSCGDKDTPCEIGGGVYHIAKPDGPGPHPAVMFLHGFGGTGKGVIRNRGMLKPILARGYAVIAPQGLPWREGSKGGAWNSMARAVRRDDVSFLQAVSAAAVEAHDIMADRILLGGFSGGGMMTWRVACDAPATFTAYAPIAGLMWRPLPETCAGPVAMQHVHGWSDPVVPIEGRSVASGRFTQGDLFEGLDLMRTALGCEKDDPDSYETTGPYQIREWTSCAPGAALEMALHPGGHRIPKGWSTLALDWFERVRPVGP